MISYTSFNDESGEPGDKLTRFKKWLWSIVEKMSNLERQELVYFWTGSPALPGMLNTSNELFFCHKFICILLIINDE